MVALYLIFFLVALDRTIIGTAIPTISAEFNSFGDIAWYESAFLLPLCVLQLSFGLVLKYYSTKCVLFIFTAIFEIGSIVCAAAPTSSALIAGRAITGIGAAAIAPGVYLMITLIVPLQDRPKYLGSLGSAFGISSILGPVLGGYLTSITWRWCFWINLPLGCTALVFLWVLAPNLPPPAQRAKTWGQTVWQLDPIGFLLFGPSISCLLFALELGGRDQKWSGSRTVALFVVFGVLLLAFVAYQLWRGEKSTLPPKIMGQRTVLVACLISFCIGAVIVIYAFYLPIWFQVVQGKSPQSSGLSLLPLLLSNVFSVVAGGFLVSRLGYFTPFAIAGSAVLVTGGALITTWTADISTGTCIGYQIFTGVGLGMCLQQPAIAIQAVLREDEISVGTSALNFAVFLGGSILVTVSQTLFEHQLVRKLIKIVPSLDPARLTGSGAANLKDLVPPAQQEEALSAYNDSMRAIWYLALTLAAVTFCASFGLEWKSIEAKPSELTSDAETNENGKFPEG
ncbi:Major facilitator superfamily domain, general substrate transporter [Akanthomyces lecanii RCEF 1005]|uniref:Major facilitator superfamily domain, general substrate transporter n=1 Tax=Akanthomyces lecanii RCEF 1005 TaxID=1081108 RepID=A0A168L2R8_CORDF|nr:Major facilitator superfamily domain, general substrate transporter [Akanthomyces lecanii RCEF 1005]